MKRFFVDCRDHPSEMKCSGAFFASTKKELLDLVLHHQIRVHKKRNSHKLRASIVKDIKEAPPLLRLHRF